MEKSPEYKKGFNDGYAIGARPLLRSAYDKLHKDYVQGYLDGYKKAGQEGDDAFQAYYSMDS